MIEIIKPLRLVSFLCIIAFNSTTWAKDVVAHKQNGSINWTTGDILANGFGITPSRYKGTNRGKLLARRAAIVDAYRNLAEITYGVTVTSEATVKNLVEQQRITKTKVSALIKGAEILTDKFNDGTATIEMRLKMGSKFLSTIMPKEQFQKLFNRQQSNLSYQYFILFLNTIVSTAHASTDQMVNIDNDEQLQWSKNLLKWMGKVKSNNIAPQLNEAIEHYEASTAYTGVVIDARNVPQLEWATHVTLVSPKGSTLYPNSQTDYGEISRNRLTSFEYDMDRALKKLRVATKPLLLKAQSVYRKRYSDLVLTKDDAKRLAQLSLRSATELNKGRVIIVVAE